MASNKNESKRSCTTDEYNKFMYLVIIKRRVKSVRTFNIRYRIIIKCWYAVRLKNS
jgi:hypothetical protein